MKKLLLFVTLVVLFSCTPVETYHWKVAIVYTNGDIDTLNLQCQGKGKTFLYLQTSVQKGFGAAGVPACLTARSYEQGNIKTFACGIRKFKIL